jgi:2-polyprenyl-6-methoxyphenol hydroxylase-like FAD-dependent oxidoreductase
LTDRGGITATQKSTVIIVGGGIGGMSAALSLARIGVSVTLLEQAPHTGEIGAGLQLGPNAFAALDAPGVGDAVRHGSVFTDRMVMMDAVDCSEMGRKYHASGVERFVRKGQWKNRAPERFFDALEWLHDLQPERCLDVAA